MKITDRRVRKGYLRWMTANYGNENNLNSMMWNR